MNRITHNHHINMSSMNIHDHHRHHMKSHEHHSEHGRWGHIPHGITSNFTENYHAIPINHSSQAHHPTLVNHSISVLNALRTSVTHHPQPALSHHAATKLYEATRDITPTHKGSTIDHMAH
jgi:hypothetical protein